LRQNLYGRPVAIKLLWRLRNVRRFVDAAALKKQIAKDIKSAKKFFGL
jgi:riboflavin kinase/FMN adenylyltransferase